MKALRLILATLCTLAAAGILYCAKADPVPHDASARVTSANFWQALARPELKRRPGDIVVYPPQRGVQLVTCVGHPTDTGAGVWKYLYVSTPDASPTVEARLRTTGVKFRTPWQYATWVRTGPWIGFSIAAALMIWPMVTGLVKILTDASEKKPASAPIGQQMPVATAADLQKLRQLEEELERGLTATSTPSTPSPTSPTQTPAGPVVLSGGPLEQIIKTAEEKKDFRGEFYPVAKPKEHGFSLVELLVVIGIIGLLLALLLPTLAGARRDANQIACAANLHSIAQGLVIYENENNGCIPASYSYAGQTITNGQQTFTGQAYVHWSYFLYHSGSTPLSAFLCPELEQGGLPPTNTTPDNMVPGQIPSAQGVIDEQVPRNAYTLNEALSPRNKFTQGFQAATRVYQFIKAASIPNSSGTILATEWGPKAARVADDALIQAPNPPLQQTSPQPPANPSSNFYLYSHRPVHGFVGVDGTLDLYQLTPATAYRRVTAADLDPDPSTASTSNTRLDWVGRNHGHVNTYPDQRRTNFLYLDGHVECKTIYDTLQPFEWGETFFTLNPNGDLQKP